MKKPTSRVPFSGLDRRSLLGGSAAVGLGALLGSGLGGFASKPALAKKRTVHFGSSLPLTGPYEKVARIYKDAYEFWSETVGGKMIVGGQEMDVAWTVYDDENNAARTAQLTERLITTDKVDLIVGAYGTDTVLAQGAIARKHGRITIQAGAASQRVDEEIGGHTTFTLVGQARSYGKLAVRKLVAAEPKPKTLAIVTFNDPVYLEMSAGLKDFAAANGVDVVLEEVLPMKVQDLRPTVLKMKRLGDVDIVYNCGWDVICIKLVQEFLALDFTPKAFVGGHLTTNAVVKETLGKNLEYALGVTFWLPQMAHSDSHFASAEVFADAFEASKGYTPTYHAAMAYTVPYLYQQVLRDASGDDPFDPDSLRASLAGLNEVPTIWGPITFNEKGRLNFPGLPVLQWQGADPQLTVVHPESLATGQLAYPMPPYRNRA